jgi:hypothetical protein
LTWAALLMASSVLLVINRQTRSLVQKGGSVSSIPDEFQSNVQEFRVQVVDPDPINFLGAYVVVDMSDGSLRMAVGDTPTGAAGGPAPLALQDTFAWDAANKWFVASLALNTAAIDAYLGSLDKKNAYLEINHTTAAGRITLLQTQFTLRAVVDELLSLVPTPTDQYFTKAEMLALFAKLKGDPGQKQVFVSPDGTKGTELGTENDGSFSQNSIPNP